MVLRQELLKRIEKKRREISELELKIRSALSYIQALEDTVKLLGNDEENVINKGIASVESASDEAMRSGSKPDRVREILSKEGKPMHIVKILEAMGEGTGLPERSGLAGSLGAYVRENKIFYRPAPNTFGLIEFQPKAVLVDEPPVEFGGEDNINQVLEGESEVPF
jgi:hypothetical protein